MKILIIAPTPFFSNRGTHIRILEEALALEKLGHEITIATYHIGENISEKIPTKIDVRRILRLLFWYKKLEAGPDWQKIFLDLMLIRKVFNLARTQKPDVIHAHLHEGVLIGWVAQKLLFWRKIKLVADFHGSLTREMVSHQYLNGGILKSFFSWIEKIINNLGDFAITSSWENTDEIKKNRKDKKVKTILDGVNLAHYSNSKQGVATPCSIQNRQDLNLPQEKTIIAYTGAIIPNKGIDVLFGAIPPVLKQNKDAYFVIAGFPIEAAKEFVKKNSLEKSVKLISPLNYFDLPKLLCACDVGVDPKDSSVGQASGKMLQYMAAGLPVVCFDRENNRRYLNGGGQYCGEVSAQSLAQGILNLIKDKEEIERKGDICLERIKKFSWDISAKKIEEIYNGLFRKVDL